MTLPSLTKYDRTRESRGCSVITTVMLGKICELLWSAVLKDWDTFPGTRLTECFLRQHLQYIVVKRRFYLNNVYSFANRATQPILSIYLCLDACKSNIYQVYCLLITLLICTKNNTNFTLFASICAILNDESTPQILLFYCTH